MRAQGLAPATIARYRCCVVDFEKHLDRTGIEDLRAVLREHVEAYQSELRLRDLSGSTRAQNIQAVSRLFDDLVDRGLLLLNPAASVPRSRREERVPRRVPSKKEVRKLLRTPNTSLRTGIRDRAIIEVLYGSAVRVGELVQLSVHDVDLEHRLLRVERGKGNKGRVVPLSAACHPWLEEYLDRVRPWWTRNKDRERRFFVTQSARPMRPAAVRQVLTRLCRDAKLRQISPHGLRHAAATHMLAAGADVRQVQKLLGHASLSTTQVYTWVTPVEVKATHARTHPREQKR